MRTGRFVPTRLARITMVPLALLTPLLIGLSACVTTTVIPAPTLAPIPPECELAVAVRSRITTERIALGDVPATATPTPSSLCITRETARAPEEDSIRYAAIARVCGNLNWTITCESPEYTDDQMLMGDSRNSYGPHAKILPSPQLVDYDDDSDFAAPRAKLVALVNVDRTTRLPSTYSNLRLREGFTCVYLRFGTTRSFRAYLTPSSGETCDPDIDPGGPGMAVKAAPLPAPFRSATDIPPVARFHEGRSGATVGVPLLGFRCGIRWCFVMPEGEDVDTLPLPFQGQRPNVTTWAAHGWHDVQHLADLNAAGQPVRGALRGSVIPDVKLRALNVAGFTTGQPELVAVVHFDDAPTMKYESDWRFRKGINEVWLTKTASGWDGEVRNERRVLFWKRKYVIKRNVKQHKHDHALPATARFLWSKYDEDLWVACELGCCQVQGKTR